MIVSARRCVACGKWLWPWESYGEARTARHVVRWHAGHVVNVRATADGAIVVEPTGESIEIPDQRS